MVEGKSSPFGLFGDAMATTCHQAGTKPRGSVGSGGLTPVGFVL